MTLRECAELHPLLTGLCVGLAIYGLSQLLRLHE